MRRHGADHHTVHLERGLRLEGDLQVTSEHADLEPEAGVVDLGERLLGGAEGLKGDDRPEDLLVARLHAGADVAEQRRCERAAVARTAGQHLGAGRADPLFDEQRGALVELWAGVVAGSFTGVALDERAETVGEPLGQRLPR